MRTAFFELLKNQMRLDDKLFLVVADMGLGLVEQFQKEFPNRFINVGIAEQNMIGISAGLCNASFRPICYTKSNFLIQRCFEQIRNDICLHKYPVVLVGTTTGFDDGRLGPTHQVIDDIGCIKALPEINIYSPSTVSSVRLVFEEILKNKKPAYVRIGKGSFDINLSNTNVNQMVISSKLSDILVITHGNILEDCVKAASINHKFSIYCMNKIKPLDKDSLNLLFKKYSKIVVIEDHFVSSGLYNTLCQYLVESNSHKTKLYSIAPLGRYEEIVGDKAFFADRYGFSPPKINKFVLNLSRK